MNQSGKPYRVIGATAAPGDDELPQFLDPICLDPDQDETLFVFNVEPSDGSPPSFTPVSHQTFEDECQSGNWQRLEPGFAFDEGYHLVALYPGKPPVYLPIQDAGRLVRARGEDKLEEVASDLEQGLALGQSDERIWYAARSLRRDPFPLLALIAMERGHLSDTLLADLEAELPKAYTTPSPMHERARQRNWGALLRLIREDPAGRHVLGPTAREIRFSYGDSTVGGAGDPVPRAQGNLDPDPPPFLAAHPNPPGFLLGMQRAFGLH